MSVIFSYSLNIFVTFMFRNFVTCDCYDGTHFCHFRYWWICLNIPPKFILNYIILKIVPDQQHSLPTYKTSPWKLSVCTFSVIIDRNMIEIDVS